MHIPATARVETSFFTMEFHSLSLKAMNILEASFQRQKNATAWLDNYLQYAKNALNQDTLSQATAPMETPKRVSRGSLPKPVRNLSGEAKVEVVVTPPPPLTPSPPPPLKKSAISVQLLTELDQCSPVAHDVHDGLVVQSEDESVYHLQVPDEYKDCEFQDENVMQSNKTFYVSPKPLNKVLLELKKAGGSASAKTPNKTRPASKRVLASSKASKHRNSLNRSIIASCQKSAGRTRIQRETREKQDHDEAIAKKQALLKMKVEEQKRKREMKMERNLRARQQIEQQQTEQRLKKMSVLQKEERRATAVKDAEKRKNAGKNKKRKQVDSSDSEKPSVTPAMKVIKVNPSKAMSARVQSDPDDEKKKIQTDEMKKLRSDEVKKPRTDEIKKPHSDKLKKPDSGICMEEGPAKTGKSLVPEADQKPLNATYIADKNENAESYAMTPCAQETSRVNYDMSDLRPSDDDDDDIDTSKPVPSWASGIRLKEALIKQFFQPPDLDELFPYIDISEDENFGMKRRKIHRTSSAVWLSTPVRNY